MDRLWHVLYLEKTAIRDIVSLERESLLAPYVSFPILPVGIVDEGWAVAVASTSVKLPPG